MDKGVVVRDTLGVLGAGASRQHLARELNAAYAQGLLSENTLSHRLDLLFGASLVDPAGLVGDLSLRLSRPQWQRKLGELLDGTVGLLKRTATPMLEHPPRLLALDWSGSAAEMFLGRNPSCDVVLSDLSVSRQHARLVFRDGRWVLQDLGSTNGTMVNGVPAGRCELRPGDELLLGDERFRID